MKTSWMNALKVLLLLVLFSSCDSTRPHQPEPKGVTVLENGQKLNGMTGFEAKFTGTPAPGNAVTISFSAGFDPYVNALDDEYGLEFSLTFPEAGLLRAGSTIDLSLVTGLTGSFEKTCFCGEPPRYSIVSSGTLTIDEVSTSAIKGSLKATFALSDRLSGSIDMAGTSYELSIGAFSAEKQQ